MNTDDSYEHKTAIIKNEYIRMIVGMNQARRNNTTDL